MYCYFHRLTRSILDHLDSAYREKWGPRVDQLATAQEIQKVFGTCRTWCQEDEQLFRARGIYVFLHLNLDLWLGGKADLGNVVVPWSAKLGLHLYTRCRDDGVRDIHIADHSGVGYHLTVTPLGGDNAAIGADNVFRS